MINRSSSSNLPRFTALYFRRSAEAGKPANTPCTRTMHPNLMEMRMFGTVATIKIKEGKGAEFELMLIYTMINCIVLRGRVKPSAGHY